LCLTLVSLSQRIVEQHAPALHVRALVRFLGLKDDVVNQVRHTPRRVVGPGPPLYHMGSHDAPIAVAPAVSSYTLSTPPKLFFIRRTRRCSFSNSSLHCLTPMTNSRL
jgi:hypothetical protein